MATTLSAKQLVDSSGQNGTTSAVTTRRRPRSRRARLRLIGLIVLAIVVLTPVFRWNALGASDPTTFAGWQTGSQVLVTAKIESTTPHALARGINKLGLLIPTGGDPNVTLDGLSQGVRPTTTFYAPYESQIGLQGFFFTALYHLGLNTTSGLELATSGIFAGTLLLFAFLLARVSRPSFGIVFLIVALGSPWLAIAGRNLYWVPWTWFLPACAAIFYIRSSGRMRLLALAALAAAFMTKWGTGYEFLTSVTLLAASMPLLAAVFALGPRHRFRRVARDTAVIVGVALACFVVSIVVLAFLDGAGNFGLGMNTILYDAGKRTYGGVTVDNSLLAQSFAAKPLDVVATYLFNWQTNVVSLGSGLPLSIVLGPNSFWLLVMAAVAVVVVRGVKRDVWWKRDAAILGIALVVPLSWFIAAKAHSYVHPYIDFVVWYLVTVGALIWVIGAALVPLVGQFAVRTLRLLRTPVGPPAS